MLELLLGSGLLTLLLLSVMTGLYLGLRKTKEYESGVDSVSFDPRKRQECEIPNSVSNRESELPPTVSDKKSRNDSDSEVKNKIFWLSE